MQKANGLQQTTPNNVSLAGIGVGASLTQPGRWELRGQWACKVGPNAGRNPTTGTDADGRSSRSRAWVDMTVSF